MDLGTLRQLAEEDGVRLRKSGDGYVARCPLHEDDSPSLSLFSRDGTGLWKCHAGCGSGSSVDWLMLVRKLSKKDALDLVKPRGENGRPPPKPKPEPERKRELGKAKPPAKLVEERGDPDRTYKWVGPNGYKVEQYRWNANGTKAKVIRWQWGAEPAKVVYPVKGKGEFRVGDVLVWTEGAKDAEAVAEAGFHSCGFAASHSVPESETLAWLKAKAPALTRWVFWADNDTQGRKAVKALRLRCAELGVEMYEVRPWEGAGKGAGAADAPTTEAAREAVQAALKAQADPLPVSVKVGDITRTALNLDKPLAEIVPANAISWELDGDKMKSDSYANAVMLCKQMGWTLSWDSFARCLYIEADGVKRRRMEDADVDYMLTIGGSKYGYRPKPEANYMRHLRVHARERGFNALKDYLTECPKPGGKPEAVRTMMAMAAKGFHLSPDEGALAAWCFLKWAAAAVRRAFRPGCEWKYVPILIGRQNARKSTALRALVPDGDWLMDKFDLAAPPKDQAEQILGVWIVECAEMEGMNSGNVSKVKAFISSLSDRYRMAYGHLAVHQPRQCVFFGTANETRLFHDMTGNVRWWPLHMRNGHDVFCDVDYIREHRDAFWGAAMVYEVNENLWLSESESESMLKFQERAQHIHPWEEKLLTEDIVIEGKSTYEILQAIGQPTTSGTAKVLANILDKRLGYTKRRQRRGITLTGTGKPNRQLCWFKKDASEPAESLPV